MKDCYYSVIENIRPHENADKLELCTVNNWQVVIQKGAWEEGERCIYVCPDATLPDQEAHEWVRPYINYLGSQNRVKTVKLRGKFSNGLAIKVSDICDVELFGDEGADELQEKLGVGHYVNGNQSDSAIYCLPFGINKTDEENWQSLCHDEIPYGSLVVITKKMDGCSATFIGTPDGEYMICGRRMRFLDESNNQYTTVGNKYKEAILQYAKHVNQTVCFRGEITGKGIQNSKYNKESQSEELMFSLFNVLHLNEQNECDRNGYYGSQNHFIKVAEITGIPTVPVLAENVELTKELCQMYADSPWSEGEGVVINHANGSFKVKSQDYYSKM